MGFSDSGRPFSEAFGIRTGDAVAIVGCGGKTGLMLRLAEENRRSRTLIATMTHILRPPPGRVDREFQVAEFPALPGVTLAHGGENPDGKLLPPSEPEKLWRRFDYSFWECDGSKERPLKGWAEHEPVVPGFVSITVGVCALWPLGYPADERVVHRLDIFCKITGCEPGEPVRLEHIAAMVSSPEGMFRRARGRSVLFVNQVESERDMENARRFSELLPPDIRAAAFAGSLNQSKLQPMEGENM